LDPFRFLYFVFDEVKMSFFRRRPAPALSMLLLPFASLTFVCSISIAQTAGTGMICGVVTDPAGLAVPSAMVVVHSIDTGIDRVLTTNDVGLYTAAFLSPGRYDVTVTQPGFANGVRKDVDLEVGRTMTVDFSLRLAASETTITVNSQGLIDSEKTESS